MVLKKCLPKLSHVLYSSIALFTTSNMVYAQQSETSELYYWSAQGKTKLTPDKENYILNAKNMNSFKKQCDLLSRKKNDHINRIGRSGFMVYESNTNLSKMDVVRSMHLEEKNWDIHPGLITEGGKEVFPTGKVLLKMKPGKSFDLLKDLLAECNVSSVKSPRQNVYTVEVDKAVESIKLANKIYESGLVAFSQPDFHIEVVFNSDPLFPEQFQFHNIGQTVGGRTGVEDIDCDALEAWEITTGDPSVIVAVFDRGLEDHPELRDANGNSKILAGFTPDNPMGNGRPDNDFEFHGMACAGIINAAHDGVGVQGLAPDVSLLSANIFVAQTIESFASSFTWAKNNGAAVISNSWSFQVECGAEQDPALNDAIRDAYLNGRNGKGCTIVFAVGNRGETIDCVSYPSILESVIGVGAITNAGEHAIYSQRGPEIGLVAPSSNLISANENVRTIDRVGSLGVNGSDYLENFGGTSAATPVVAGVAALMYSVNPDLTASQVEEILFSTADDMGPSGRDNTFGYGRVNAHQAVLAAQALLAPTAPVTPVTTPTPVAVSSGSFDFGPNSSDVAAGFTKVNPRITTGAYRWINPVNLRARDRGINASTSNLNSDFIFSDSANTFAVDVPNGNYNVTVTLGDRRNRHDNVRVSAEGNIINNNITTNAGQFVSETFNVTVTDGVLSLEFSDQGGRDDNWAVTSVSYTSGSSAPSTPVAVSNTINLGNASNINATADGWRSNLVINETDVYTNNSGSSQEISINQFSFYARRQADPVTPFVVRVNADNDFTVLAIGTTRTSSDYVTGENSVPFSTNNTSFTMGNGETIAIGFLDANANGSSNGVGSVIPFSSNTADQIWYSGGPNGADAASIRLGNAPSAGARTITRLRRNYHFNIDFTTTTTRNSGAKIVLGEAEVVDVNLSLYPNPAVTDLTIEGIVAENVDVINIYDISGALVKEVDTTSIDVTELAQGIYFVQVISDGINYKTLKFVKE